MFSWHSEQYLRFKGERTQPAVDLANRITVNPNTIIDIGCGPGNSTAVLQNRFSDAEIIGIDSSQNMINRAKKEHSSIEFNCCDVRTLFDKEDKYDVVFSNACIQWIPNHNELVKNLFGLLNKNGVLAVQIPFNFSEPIRQIITKTVLSDKWKNHFKGTRTMYVLSESKYYDLLSEITDNFSLWQTVYYHTMHSHQDIIEWYRGTGLRPYLEQLDDDLQREFESDILEQIKTAYPVQKNGDIIFKFPRLFFMLVNK